MALPQSFDSADSIPEPLREHYTQNDRGKFVLQVQGVQNLPGLVSALEAERQQRAEAVRQREAATTERDEAKAQLQVAATKLKDLETRAQGGGGTGDATKFQEELAEMKRHTEERIKALEAANAKERDLREKAQAEVIESKTMDGLRQAAIKAGFDELAIPDAINRARPIWRAGKDGNPVAMNGDVPKYDPDDQTQPLSMERHMAMILKDAPHLGKRPVGANAPGGANTNGTNSGNVDLSRLPPVERLKIARQQAQQRS